MRHVDLWTTDGEHYVFNNVLLAGPTERERFFCVRREDRSDFIPYQHILRVTVTDEGWQIGRNLKDKKKPKHSRSKQTS